MSPNTPPSLFCQDVVHVDTRRPVRLRGHDPATVCRCQYTVQLLVCPVDAGQWGKARATEASLAPGCSHGPSCPTWQAPHLLLLSILNLLATRTHNSPTGAALKHTPLFPWPPPPRHGEPAHAKPSCSLTFSSRDRISRKDGRAVAERAQQSRSRAANVELTVLGMTGMEPWMTALYTSI